METKFSFHKKNGIFNTKEIKGLLPCKCCGEQPLMHHKENETGEFEISFFCSCKEFQQSEFVSNMKIAISLWNMKNKICVPTGKAFSLLNYAGIAMSHNTFYRFTRWKRSNIPTENEFNFVSELSNGLKIFVSKNMPDDVIRFLNKSETKITKQTETEPVNEIKTE